MNTSDLLPVTTADMIAEVRRELAQRERFYPRFVADKKLPQDRADLQMARLRAVLAFLERAP